MNAPVRNTEVDAINAVFTDRSAGRWCAHCQQHGSHHTERHQDFADHARTTLADRATSLVGKIVRDTTVEDSMALHGTYAIGTRGFLCLGTGQYLPYDSAFPGPDYFTNPVFIQIDITENIHA